MVSDMFFAFTLIASNLYAVAATGGFPPVTGPPGACGLLPADASCAAVFLGCVKTLKNKSDPYSNEACVAAATCYPTNPDSFLASLSCRIGSGGTPLHSSEIPRAADTIISKLLVNDTFATYSSYASWYKGVATNADPDVTVLIDPAFVKMSYDIVLAWTSFCSSGNIPKNNFGDWLQYFSSVKAPQTTCNLVSNCPITYYPYVMDLTVSCAKHKDAISNTFDIETCVAAGLHWPDGVDNFLQAVACRYGLNYNTDQPAPQSNSLPDTFQLPAPNSFKIQNFLDFTNAALKSIGTSDARSPSINTDFVTYRWALIVAWANSCSTSAVSHQQIADFLKYSHTVLTKTSC
ncbi:hypothetical protein JOM56_003251 [Amanita muscaria]